MIEGHGDDIYKYGNAIRHNFSSNILQGIDHAGLKKHLSERLDCISNYPEPAPSTVEQLLSEQIGLPAPCIMVTNGAADAIYIIARANQGQCSAVVQPTFSEYVDACKISSHNVNSIHSIDDIPERTDLIWICNPNNPTGGVLPVSKLHKILKDNPDKTFVVDQAYHKYTKCELLSPADVLHYNNLILIYSMTKDYAVPGLRIGYVVSNQSTVSALKAFRIPWSVNALAIESAKYLLQSASMPFDIDSLLGEKQRVSAALKEIGIKVEKSDTNFMLCVLPRGKASMLKEYLVEMHGILIRDASNFEGLSDKHFRIAVQSREENDLLIKALNRWIYFYAVCHC